MILKNLLRRKTRSVLTVLGIALGIAAIVALTTIGAGFADSFGNLFATSDADLTLSQADAYDLFLSSLDEGIGEQVARMPQVQAVAGIIYSGVRLEGIPFEGQIQLRPVGIVAVQSQDRFFVSRRGR